MIVDVLVNDAVTAPFLVDTGASAIAIPQALLHPLGIRLDAGVPRIQVQTAGGLVEEPLVRLDSVQLGAARVEQLDALVSSEMQIGLLGGNFFNNFVYSVDAAAGEITLKANERMRAGASAELGGARCARPPAAPPRLDARLAELENHQGDQLRDNRERFAEALEALHQEANAAGVPQAWRRGW
jgi:clan AA aspartic protease (TIGR02281 family)